MYHSKMETAVIDRFFDAMLTLRSRDEFYRFFDDVATAGELGDMAQRFEVAELLAEGGRYNAIVEKTGASTATISRVNPSFSASARRGWIYPAKNCRRLSS